MVCEGASGEPCKSFKLPFHLGIDQQERIWGDQCGLDFPASDPTKVNIFKAGDYSGSCTRHSTAKANVRGNNRLALSAASPGYWTLASL